MTHCRAEALPLSAIFELQREIDSKVKWRSIQGTYHFVGSCQYWGNFRLLLSQQHFLKREEKDVMKSGLK